MLIKRILVTSALIFGVLHVHAMSEGSDSHCVVGKDNTLFNQCGYAVDVSFCVENPQQTKNFFDSSDAFRCPNGGLSTLGPGREEGNILHGTVHWFACNTKYRGKGRWDYVPGSGYRGHCTKNEPSANSGSRLVEPGARDAEVWSEVVQCTNWIPDQPGIWREVDPVTQKEMCKAAQSPAAKEVAARAFAERKRVAAEVVQRKRDEAAQAEQRKQAEATRSEQEFRTSLQTMNPGQMLARADELGAQGDRTRAREVLRAMIGRFPNHQLTAVAVQQLSGDASTGSSAQQAEVGRGSSNPGAAAPARPGGLTVVSAKDCIPEQNKLREMLERNDARASVPRPARWPSPSALTQDHVNSVAARANALDRAEVEEYLPRFIGPIARNTSELNNARQNHGDVEKFEFDLLKNYFDRCFFRARISLK